MGISPLHCKKNLQNKIVIFCKHFCVKPKRTLLVRSCVYNNKNLPNKEKMLNVSESFLFPSSEAKKYKETRKNYLKYLN